MASVMGICGGLVGPKSGNVEKVLVFKAFLKGQRSEEESKRTNSPTRSGRKSEIFDVKWLVSISRIVFPT